MAAVFAASLVLLCGACGQIPPDPPDASHSTETRGADDIRLTQRGLGDFEVGASTSVTDAEAYFGGYFEPKPQTEQCGLWIAADQRIAVVADENTATLALVIEDPRLRTAEGIGVGSAVKDVIDAYGERVTVLEDDSQTGGPIVVVDDLTRPGQELTWESRLMAFDTDPAQNVTRVRIGMWPWVGYTDYCSDYGGRSAEGIGWPLTRMQ